MTTPHTYFAKKSELTGLQIGDLYLPTGAEAKHIAVKRPNISEVIDFVDGQGLRVRTKYGQKGGSADSGQTSEVKQSNMKAHSNGKSVGADGIANSDIAFKVTSIVQEAPPNVRITLVQALAKDGRFEAAVEAATELGVMRVIPWQANRSIVQWDAKKEVRQLLALQNLMVAASKQSRRSYFPELSPKRTSKQLIQTLSADNQHIFILHEAATDRFVDQLADLYSVHHKAQNSEPLQETASKSNHSQNITSAEQTLIQPLHITLVVGPEGGISDEELLAFSELNAHQSLLTNSVLRTSTATIAALTLATQLF